MGFNSAFKGLRVIPHYNSHNRRQNCYFKTVGQLNNGCETHEMREYTLRANRKLYRKIGLPPYSIPPLSNSHFFKTHNYHRPSAETNISSVGQKILFIVCSPILHYRLHKRPSFFNNRSQINPFHAYHPLSVSSTSILSSNLHLGLSRVFAYGFRHQNSVCVSPRPMRATCPTNFFLL
jgi:hypothetical protein